MPAENSDGGPHCRYCGALLSHPESLYRGYGRDCAEEHGQPWGMQDDIPGGIHRETALDRASREREIAEAEWDENLPGDAWGQYRDRRAA